MRRPNRIELSSCSERSAPASACTTSSVSDEKMPNKDSLPSAPPFQSARIVVSQYTGTTICVAPGSGSGRTKPRKKSRYERRPAMAIAQFFDSGARM